MKIVRNGVEYELTARELTDAYYEQEHLFDVADVESELQCIVDDGCDKPERIAAAKTILAAADKLGDCAYNKRRNEDKYGMDWSSATSEAVRDAIRAEMERV